MIDYKKAAVIAAKHNAKLKALVAEYNMEMFAEFGERYRKAYIPSLYAMFDRVSEEELQAASEYIFDVREWIDWDEYEADVDGVRIRLAVN